MNINLSRLMKHGKSYILQETFFGSILRTPTPVRRARRKPLYCRTQNNQTLS